MMMKPLQTYAKQEFLFYGVLLAMERLFVYGEKIVLRFLLVLVFIVIIRFNEDEQLEIQLSFFACRRLSR
jgi:cytochrome c oxidase subunit IV